MSLYPDTFPYSPRSGITIENDVAVLLAEPAIRLSDHDRSLATEFSHGLATGNVGDMAVPLAAEGQQPLSLTTVRKISLVGSSATFYNDFFRSPASSNHPTATGGADKPGVDTPYKLYYSIAHGEPVDRKRFKTIAAASLKWYRENFMVKPDVETTYDLSISDISRVDFDPDKTIDMLAKLQSYRWFYRAVRTDVRGAVEHASPDNPGWPLLMAKQALLDVHTGGLNAAAALTYPQGLALAEQLDKSPTTEATERWKSTLDDVMPVIKNRNEKRPRIEISSFDRLARRLDLIRNGAGEDYDSTGNASPISREVLQLCDRLESELPDNDNTEHATDLTSEQIELIKQSSWNATELKNFLVQLLGESGLLSEYSTPLDEYKNRSGPVSDNKWQVHVDPDASNLITVNSKKSMVIPGDFQRTMLQRTPAGCLPVAAHEFAHVIQAEANDRLAETLPIAGIGGRGNLVVEELGGIYYEGQSFNQFGIGRKANTTYARALAVKLDNGTARDAAASFYEVKMKQPGSDSDRALLSARATLRLYRHYGHNSQPLNYVEQDLALTVLERQCTDQVVGAVVLNCSAFSLADAAKLHAADLLPLPDGSQSDPTALVYDLYVRDYLPKLAV